MLAYILIENAIIRTRQSNKNANLLADFKTIQNEDRFKFSTWIYLDKLQKIRNFFPILCSKFKKVCSIYVNTSIIARQRIKMQTVFKNYIYLSLLLEIIFPTK